MGGTFKHQLIFALILTIISGSAYAEFEVSDRDIFYGHIRNQADNLFNRADLENSTSGGAAPSEHSYEDIQLDLAELAAVEEELLQMQNVTPEFLSTEEVEALVDDLRVVDRSALPSMTLLQAFDLALENHPEVGIALAREERSRWFFAESRSYKYPTVDFINEFGPEYNRPATNSSDNEDVTPGRSFVVRVSQLLYDGGVAESEEYRRFQVRKSTEIETRLVVEEVIFETMQSYLQVYQSQQAVTAAEEFVVEMQSIVDQLKTMFDNGAASKLELDFAKARLASAQAEAGNTTAQLNNAVSDLEFWTGPLQTFNAKQPMDVDKLDIAPLDYYVDTARENNANLLLNRSNMRAEEFRVRGQKGTFLPTLTLNFASRTLADEGGNQALRNTSEVKLRAEYFLFDGGARKARLNQARARLRELGFEDKRLQLQLDRVIKQAFNQITTTRVTLNATLDEIRHNRELRRLNRQNLEIGDISIIELIEVEERLFNSQATLFNVRSDMLRSYYELVIEAGLLNQIVQTELSQTRISE